MNHRHGEIGGSDWGGRARPDHADKRVVVHPVQVYSYPRSPSCGFSIYKGVIIQWDEDYDERVFAWVDRYGLGARMVAEYEGRMTIVWNSRDYDRPYEYSVCGDIWTVEEHIEP